jgi:cell division protein FtsN
MARKPASRGASRSSRKPERQVPAWVWIFTGVVSGAFVMFLYHLATLRMNAPQAAVADKPAASTKADDNQSGPRFDFYAVLPKMEVIVPKGEDDPQPARRAPPPSQPDSGSATATESATTAPASTRQDQYLLQAGSFRRSDDADRRRGELILHGLTARVQPVAMGNGDTWYRVMVGPFDNANAAHRAQDRLASAGIETLAIRARTD